MAGAPSVSMPTEPAACFKDTDCPQPYCGGQVCNWNKVSDRPMGDRFYQCNPAGSSPTGQDGWCVTDDDCKCRGAGARCLAPYCSFTLASDTPQP
jgi:hypothetical protein